MGIAPARMRASTTSGAPFRVTLSESPGVPLVLDSPEQRVHVAFPRAGIKDREQVEAALHGQFDPREQRQRAEAWRGRPRIALCLHLRIRLLEAIHPSTAVVVGHSHAVDPSGHESK